MRNKDIINKYGEDKNLEFLFFWGHTNNTKEIDKTCLSQWYEGFGFSDSEYKYPTCEHYMMVKKSLLMNPEDKDTCIKILNCTHPREAKIMGRKVNNFDSLKWDENKFNIVAEGNYLKFSQNKNLKEYLLSTGNKILVESSPYDNVWGIGMSINSKEVEDPSNWKGENLLGYALMEARERIKNK